MIWSFHLQEHRRDENNRAAERDEMEGSNLKSFFIISLFLPSILFSEPTTR